MDFDQTMAHVRALNRETLAVLDGLQIGRAELSTPLTLPDFAAGMELHEKRMKYIHLLLAEITEKLRRLTGRQ